MPDHCDLKTLEQISLMVVEASPDANVVIDEGGRVVIFNHRAELMFGYAREEVLGREVEVLLPEGYRGRHARHRADYFGNPLVREMGAGMVLQGRHRSGRAFPVQIRLAPLPPVSGAGVFALAVVRRAPAGEGGVDDG